MLVPRLEPTWLPTILLPSRLLSGARKREVGQREGLERVAERHKRLHSTCSPKASTSEPFQSEMWQVGAVEGPGLGRMVVVVAEKRDWRGRALSGEHISLLADNSALEVSNLQWGEFHLDLLSLPHGHNAGDGIHREGQWGKFSPVVHGAVRGAALAQLIFLRTWGQTESQ